MFPPALLFPTITPEVVEEVRQEFDEQSVDKQTGDLLLTARAYVVRTQRQVILIDSCNGNHKPRPAFPSTDRLETPYLDRLQAAGVTPEQVDIVICTHLHPDHVGWNTRLADGRSVPTFPNAKYLVGQTEFDDMKSLHDAGSGEDLMQQILTATFEDSVLPIVAHNQAVFIDQGHVVEQELDHGVRLESAPGHTRGHVSIHIEGAGQHALATGDAFHHLLQLNRVDLPGPDADPEQAIATRRRLFDTYTDTSTIVLPAHFPAPGAGRLVHRQGRLGFEFLEAQPGPASSGRRV